MPRLALVVPCFNEGSRLQLATFASFVADTDGIDLLFVDDGSRDDTRAILDRFAADHAGRVRVLSLAHNSGKGEAVRRGIIEALASHPDYVGFWDADLATPLDEIGRYLDILEEKPGVQMVFGSRVQLLGRVVERRAVRHYSGRVFATLASMLLDLRIYDTQCGAKIFRATPRVAAVFDAPFLSRWIFDVEVIARFGVDRDNGRYDSARLAREIYELPLETWIDVAGSKRGVEAAVRAIGELAQIWSRYFAGRPGTPRRKSKT